LWSKEQMAGRLQLASSRSSMKAHDATTQRA
jgi:hypothetical protein